MKYMLDDGKPVKMMSLPSRERGLKYIIDSIWIKFFKSLPSRERGLKSTITPFIMPICPVAPFAGAWIEIYYYAFYNAYMPRRSLRGSVD